EALLGAAHARTDARLLPATPGRRSLGSRPQRRGAPCRGRERPRSRCAAAGRARIGCARAGHQGMSRHEAGRALICGSQAFITTDLDDNQITAFHPGAMQHAHLNRVSDAQRIALGIVAPDGREGMIQHAAQFADARIPFIFDPGQGLPILSGAELSRMVSQATWVTVNDYEWQLLTQKTSWGVREVTERVSALIVTRGAAGSVIHTRDGELAIPCAPAREVVDPTGCGDAYRAGLIHGLL